MLRLSQKHLFFKTKVTFLYQKLNSLNLNNAYELEILKLMGQDQNNSLPDCFDDFFALPSKLHSELDLLLVITIILQRDLTNQIRNTRFTIKVQ